MIGLCGYPGMLGWSADGKGVTGRSDKDDGVVGVHLVARHSGQHLGPAHGHLYWTVAGSTREKSSQWFQVSCILTSESTANFQWDHPDASHRHLEHFGKNFPFHFRSEMSDYEQGFAYVPFKGGGEVCVELVGKHIDSTVNNPSECVSHWRAGKVRPLALIDSERIALPEWDKIPTLKEASGVDISYLMLRGIFAPPKIKKEEGLVRLVFGLGTRAVDRVGSDYPRISH
jgi:hypothetical protein